MRTRHAVIAILVVLLLLDLSIEAARKYGYQEGLNESQGACLGGQLTESRDALRQFSEGVERAAELANQANRQISEQIAGLRERHEQEMKELKNALKNSAGTRDCRFDADSMQRAEKARAAAAAAAAAGTKHSATRPGGVANQVSGTSGVR